MADTSKESGKAEETLEKGFKKGPHPYPDIKDQTPPFDPEGYASDPFGDESGVLLGDQIQKYIDTLQPPLITEPSNDSPSVEVKASEEKIEAASFDLTLGEEYYQDGEIRYLDDKHRFIQIKPHGLVVVSTREILHMPRYLIGRWNLKIGLVYKGLIWAGGPQVDPGFQGSLHCPLYNLTDDNVTIELKKHIVTIDFVKTTSYSKSAEKFRFGKKDEKPGKNLTDGPYRTLGDYVKSPTFTSALEGIYDNLSEYKKEVRDTNLRTEERVVSFESNMFLVLSIVFAAIAIVGLAPFMTKDVILAPNLVAVLFMVFSAVALGLSIIAIAFSRTRYSR